MRSIIALVGLVTLSAGADDLCDQVSEAAINVMEARQGGVSRTAMKRIADQQESPEREVMIELIVAAYESEVLLSAEARQRKISEFGDASYEKCLESQKPD
ncbi:hypothetical protein [uncultured Halopseudomonas sp.]|uniref:hypothetical protein n=1 Tax=uncultured Halopseudomonas sp. TaxID=2901193 RepID=UPI0030ED2626|tara:strand:- start:48215 stop:48517 length:303 start_codon:yes stop_codon:yes gene_type:complete